MDNVKSDATPPKREPKVMGALILSTVAHLVNLVMSWHF